MAKYFIKNNGLQFIHPLMLLPCIIEDRSPLLTLGKMPMWRISQPWFILTIVP